MPTIPESLIVPHDDHHGQYVGTTADGRQFFLTTPFVAHTEGVRYPKDLQREFVALYLFSPSGDLISAEIEDLGSRVDLLGAEAARILPGNVARSNSTSETHIEKLLQSLGKVTFQDIRVKPFELWRFEIRFGLIPEFPEVEDGVTDDEFMYLILEPGNYMAFSPPWKGEYDT